MDGTCANRTEYCRLPAPLDDTDTSSSPHAEVEDDLPHGTLVILAQTRGEILFHRFTAEPIWHSLQGINDHDLGGQS